MEIKKKKKYGKMATGNLNSVPASEFAIATSGWVTVRETHNGMIGNVILPQVFNIPMTDLVELVQEINEDGKEKAVSVRAFIGIKELDPDQNNFEMKLYLTGVNVAGEPIFVSDNQSTIYDFVSACPPTC